MTEKLNTHHRRLLAYLQDGWRLAPPQWEMGRVTTMSGHPHNPVVCSYRLSLRTAETLEAEGLVDDCWKVTPAGTAYEVGVVAKAMAAADRPVDVASLKADADAAHAAMWDARLAMRAGRGTDGFDALRDAYWKAEGVMKKTRAALWDAGGRLGRGV